MNMSTIKNPTFQDAQKLNSFYTTIESKNVLYNKLSNLIDSNYINSLSNLNVHEIYNYILLKYYPNETSIKSSFINRILMTGKKHVTIFELPIINSRADLCKVNGESIVYEIKTDLDNFSRLPKQIDDYKEIFDKSFVICSTEKVIQIKEYIPKETGIYSYKITKTGKYIFKMERSALISKTLNCKEQLSILRKNELIKLIRNCDYSTRKEMIDYILGTKTQEQINKIFKQSLKTRYQKQWDFFKVNHDQILEIDYQWFFKNAVNPKSIYN